MGFQVVAATCPEALHAALAERWDAVVVDASSRRLPIERVLELITARDVSLPMVAVASSESEVEGIALLERGFSDYLLPDRLGRLPFAVRAAAERSELALRAAEAENAGRLRERHLRAVRALSASSDGAVFEGVLEEVALSVAGTEARLWEADARGGLHRRAIWRASGVGGPSHGFLPALPTAAVGRAMTGGRPEIERAGAAREGRVCVAVPVVNGHQAVGAIEICAPDVSIADGPLQLHLIVVGGHLGTYLGRRRSEADLARSLEELHRTESERRRLLRLLVQAHEDERRSIAADIHDDPLQVMAAVALRLSALRRRLEDEPAIRTLESVEEMMSSAMSRLRTLMFNLRPPALEQGELLGPLRVRLEQVRREEIIEYSVAGEEPVALTTEARVTLYRIAQEAIVNVVKHASASHIEVVVDEQDGGCRMRIVDDGIGLGPTPPDRPGHLGLPGMREWAELAGGWLRLEDGERVGTLVTAWVPAPGLPPAANRDAP